MSLATTAPASATAARYRAPDERAGARLREAAARVATSLAHFAASHSRRSTISERPVLVEDVVTDGEAHRVRGEVLALASGTPVVLVTVHRHPAGHPSHDLLRAAYALTSVESRVATLLAARMSNREIMQLLGVTEYTARRHTESVMRKLGVNRRTAVRHELLRCLERSQASAGPGGSTGEGAITGADSARQFGQDAGAAAAVEELQPPWVGAAPVAVLVELESASARKGAGERSERRPLSSTGGRPVPAGTACCSPLASPRPLPPPLTRARASLASGMGCDSRRPSSPWRST